MVGINDWDQRMESLECEQRKFRIDDGVRGTNITSQRPDASRRCRSAFA